MGRYAGEEIEYDYSPHEHSYAYNGRCVICGMSEEDLKAEARKVLGLPESRTSREP